VVLSCEERSVLVGWARRRKTAQALALRARIVLACAEGGTISEVAQELELSRGTVSKWRSRFLVDRLEGLSDEPRPGRPRTITDEQVEQVLTKTLEQRGHTSATRAVTAPRAPWRGWRASRPTIASAAQPHRPLVARIVERATGHEGARGDIGEPAKVLAPRGTRGHGGSRPPEAGAQIRTLPGRRTGNSQKAASGKLLSCRPHVLLTRWCTFRREQRSQRRPRGTALLDEFEFRTAGRRPGVGRAARRGVSCCWYWRADLDAQQHQ
jgi:transposase